MASGFKNFWPDVTDLESARATAKRGWQAAFVVSSLTAIIASIAAVRGPFLGYDAWSFVDAAFTAVIGWRIMRMSRAWAVVGLAYWLVNLASRAIDPSSVRLSGMGVAIIMLFGFINGVRGTFAHRRLQKTALAVAVAV
jgi:hypothetical protein